jgi:hypothetical protein
MNRTTNRTTTFAAIAALAAGLSTTAASAQPDATYDGRPISYEEALARAETDMVLRHPIAGVTNDYWFNYETDIAEARKEFSKDMAGASDTEDRRDAWEEYRSEMADARHDYAKEMREKGYRVGEVRMVPDTGR